MPLSAALASATLVKTAGSSVFRSALPHLLNPWTRIKTLEYLHAELLEYCASTEQANDLYNRIKDESFLKRIASLRTVEEIHREVGAVIHPQGATDPQREEAMVLTRALFSALFRATSPGTHAAMTNSMLLHSYLKDSLPGFSEMLHAHRRRREQPGESAKADIADLLERAGQKKMGIVVFKDRPAEVVGQPRIQLQFGGQNAELYRQWSEGGHGASLALQAENGELNLSFGHKELDRLLFPQGHKATRLEINEVKTEFQARVRVSAAGEPDVFVPIILGIAPRTREIEVKFGANKCFIWFTLALLKSGGQHFNIQLQVGAVSQVLPIEYRSVLRAMRLLGRDDMQVFLPTGTEFVRPDGTSVKLEKDTPLIDGRIWQARKGTEKPRMEAAMVVLSEVHLLYQQIATFLEDEHGVDPSEMVAPEELSADDIDALRRTVSAINGSTSIPVNVNLKVSQEQSELIAASERLEEQGADESVHIKVTCVLDIGVRVLVTVGTVREVKILETKHLDDLISIQASGVLKNQPLTVHPAGSFRDGFPEENTTN